MTSDLKKYSSDFDVVLSDKLVVTEVRSESFGSSQRSEAKASGWLQSAV